MHTFKMDGMSDFILMTFLQSFTNGTDVLFSWIVHNVAVLPLRVTANAMCCEF